MFQIRKFLFGEKMFLEFCLNCAGFSGKTKAHSNKTGMIVESIQMTRKKQYFEEPCLLVSSWKNYFSVSQVPPDEREAVKKDTMEKLRRCWRGVSEKQVFYLSTINVS